MTSKSDFQFKSNVVADELLVARRRGKEQQRTASVKFVRKMPWMAECA
jgi:hypothetical protein